MQRHSTATDALNYVTHYPSRLGRKTFETITNFFVVEVVEGAHSMLVYWKKGVSPDAKKPIGILSAPIGIHALK